MERCFGSKGRNCERKMNGNDKKEKMFLMCIYRSKNGTTAIENEITSQRIMEGDEDKLDLRIVKYRF